MSCAVENQKNSSKPYSPRRERFADPPGACSRSSVAFPITRFALFRLLAGIAALLLLAVNMPAAQAQNAVLGRGDAVVTGFSGIKPADVPVPPGANPLDEFFIDPDGVSAQILSLDAFGQPPQGQLVATPPKLQLKAGQVGQIFAIALDDGLGAPVPNVYLGATASYGLQIVLPDSDGDGAPERVNKGHPNGMWMAGQFGPDPASGPGSIWRVDGQSGAVSLFTTLPENAGPGVGDVVFDRASRQFFASDLDSGLIYRISATGQIIDSFDHGVAGRPRKGLAAVGDDGSRLDIKNAAFDSLDPGTWGYTAEERRVHGMAVLGGRLYYAVAGQVWSVGISQAGFADDARWELDAKGISGDGPITDMLFDGEGRIYLAQRGTQRNSYDYSVFADAEKSNVVRYRREEPDNPTTESAWIEDPETYSIGLPPEHRHAEGGISLGYAHDDNGMLRRGACGQMLWSTGHRLRQGADDAETAEADVHGLQGNDVSLTQPQNTPPQQSYFADYDNLFGDAAKSGHVGDVEIWQPCDTAGFTQPFGQLPPGVLPPGDVPPELPPEFPGDDYHTNLKLTKHAMPKVCWNWAGGWLCRYRIRITNTGPDNYFGPLLVSDWLPAAPAGALMGFSPTPPWACWATGPSAHSCFRPGVFLAPGWSTDLIAFAWVPKSYPLCHLTNGAAIEWAPPGSQWNSNPFDDADFAAAIIPAEHCKPGPRTDLKIYKVPYGKCFPNAGKIRCVYVISVQNVGTAPYVGAIVVEDTVPAGTTAVFGGAPWAPCAGPVGSTYTCTHPGANLAPGAFAPPIFVGVDTPVPLAKQMNCRVRNRAEITQATGGSTQNFDPTNDTADAVATVPAEVCHEQPRRSNLKIEKRAGHVLCQLGQSDWCKGFRITVTNTGPNAFNGIITVSDVAPAGLIVQASGPGWTCVGATCTTNAAVLLNKNPPSADGVSFNVTVKGTAAQARAMDCKLTNRAKIDSPLGAPKNIHAGDDMDQVTVDLPAKFCERPVPQTNLSLEKTVDANGCLTGSGAFHCYYNVIVTNTGPGDYNDKIVVDEHTPAGTTALFNGVGWNCAGGGQDYACTRDPVLLKTGEKVVLGAQVNVPANLAQRLNCNVTNQAAISYAPGNSGQNTDASDDQGEATASLPAGLCANSTVPACPPGYRWTGERCAYPDPVCKRGWTPTPVKGQCCPPGKPWNQRLRQCGGDTPPPPPPAECERGWTPTPVKGQCCPPGEPWNLRLRQCGGDIPPPPPPAECRRGWTPTPVKGQCCPPGKPWNLRLRQCGGDTPPPPPPPPAECQRGWTPTPVKGQCCPPGKPWTGQQCGRDIPPPSCNRTARCIGGKVWNMEACACVCPQGRVMRHGQCVVDQPECPPGTTGRPPRCKPIVLSCPRGTMGTPPNCHRPVCPRGTRGIFPNCRKEPPEQVRPCPRGTVGRYPNCRPIVRVCPPGTFGRPPLCRRLNVRPQGGPFQPGGRVPRIDNPPRVFPRPGGGQSPIR
jgi:hypothetical protein